MHVVVFACRENLGALVKQHFDDRRVGLTTMVVVADLTGAARALESLTTSLVVIVDAEFGAAGRDLCRRLRENPATRELPLVVAVEEAGEEERIAALDAGADAVVHPFNVEVILARVAATWRRIGAPRMRRSDDLVVAPDGSTAILSDRPVRLTARESSVLRVLVQGRNAAISRTELEQAIWGGRCSRALDVHIARLRKKLGVAGRRIETVSKVGYRYVERL